MTDKRRGGGEQRGAGARRMTGTRLTVEGDVVMEDADENPKRAVGRATYRGYGEQSGTERTADGKQYRGTVTERSARS